VPSRSWTIQEPLVDGFITQKLTGYPAAMPLTRKAVVSSADAALRTSGSIGSNRSMNARLVYCVAVYIAGLVTAAPERPLRNA